MKINFACGKQTWEGFYCIDAVQHEKASRPVDLIFAFEFNEVGFLQERLPLESECADEVHAYHFIEHVHEWEAPAVITEFRRLLKPGGKLILECPDLELACRNLVKGCYTENMWLWPLYGDGSHKDPYMCHKFGYTEQMLTELLKKNGMKSIFRQKPQTHGRKARRDMRLVCHR